MLNFIRHGETLVAIIVGDEHRASETRFLTPSTEPMQWGIGVFKAGQQVEPHCHKGPETKVNEFQELLLVRRGKMRANIYYPLDHKIAEVVMQQGDALLLLRGGHGFEFLEDTELFEVKQGPYVGRSQMKTMLTDIPRLDASSTQSQRPSSSADR